MKSAKHRTHKKQDASKGSKIKPKQKRSTGWPLYMISTVLVVVAALAMLGYNMWPAQSTSKEAEIPKAYEALKTLDNDSKMTDSSSWREDLELAKQASGSVCAFTRLDGRNISAHEFEQLYRENKPLIIEGLLEAWPARTAWSRQNLMRNYGNRMLQTGSGGAIVYGGGAGGVKMSLRERLEIMSDRNDTSGDSLFSFDVGFFRSVPEMKRDFQTPALFSAFDNSQTTKERLSWHIISLGPTRSGLPFHVHGETWLGLVFGKKWWFLYPAGAPMLIGTEYELRDLFNPLYSVWKWFQTNLPRLQQNNAVSPLQCIQNPGEVVYIPSGWKHLTLNIGDAIGVGGQAAYRTEHRLDIAQRALQTNPIDFESLKDAGLAHAHNAIDERGAEGTPHSREQIEWHFEQSIAYLERAIAAKPLNPEVHALLTEVHLKHGDMDAVRFVLQRATKIFDDFMESPGMDLNLGTLAYVYLNLGRAYMMCSLPHDAMPLLEKALSLAPHGLPVIDEINAANAMIEEQERRHGEEM